MRTADTIEASNSVKSLKPPKTDKRGTHPNSLKNLMPPWPKGFCANPGGKNQHDSCKMISRMIFESNFQSVYEAQLGAVLSGNAYAYKEHADRAYGKIKESLDISGLEGLADAISRARNRAK